MESTRSLLRSWTAATIGAGLAGALIIGVAGALIVVLSPGQAQMSWVGWSLLPMVALLQGLVLGQLQWRALAPVLPELDHDRWTTATMVGALIAWMMAMGIASWVTPAPLDAEALVPLVIATGGLGGAMVGAAQAYALRGQLPVGMSWILVSSLGWSAGVGVGFAGAALTARLEGVALVVTGLCTGAAAGAVAGLITGAVLIDSAREAGAVTLEPARRRRAPALGPGPFAPVLR